MRAMYGTERRMGRRMKIVLAVVGGAVCGAATYRALSSVMMERRERRDEKDASGTDGGGKDDGRERARGEASETRVVAVESEARVRARVEDVEVDARGDGAAAAAARETRAAPAERIDVRNTADARAVYESLELAFAQSGLDPSSLTPRKFFSFGRFPEAGVWPRRYADCEMPKDCARLVILTMDEAPAIVAAVQGATRELMRLVGGKMDAFAPGRPELHVTLFHVSRTFDYVQPPAAFAIEDAMGGGTRTLPRDARIEDAIAYEESAIADAVRGCGPCELEVDRVCFAPSGCLLLCFADVHGAVQNIRERLRDKVIGASRRQNDTVHCTLARLFPKEDARLDDETVRAINMMCAKVTSSLRGARFRAQAVTYAVEEHFGLVDGRRSRIQL